MDERKMFKKMPQAGLLWDKVEFKTKALLDIKKVI